MSRHEAHRPEAPGEERPGQFPVGPGAIRAAGLRHPGPNQRAPRADQNSAAGRGEFLGHGRGPARPPAVGRALSELVTYGGFRTLDLQALGWDRVLKNQPLFEINIV